MYKERLCRSIFGSKVSVKENGRKRCAKTWRAPEPWGLTWRDSSSKRLTPRRLAKIGELADNEVHSLQGSGGGSMPNILTSWKEIAQYVGKGVRTVQRWERESGLPVRRQIQSAPHAVVAFPEELDAWVRSRTRGPSGALTELFRREIAALRAANAALSARVELLEAAVLVRTPTPVWAGPFEAAGSRSLEIQLEAQRCRADAIRTRLSTASTYCAISKIRARNGDGGTLELAQRGALEIERCLQCPGYVPANELHGLRALLSQLLSRIQQVIETSSCGLAAEAVSSDDREIIQ